MIGPRSWRTGRMLRPFPGIVHQIRFSPFVGSTREIRYSQLCNGIVRQIGGTISAMAMMERVSYAQGYVDAYRPDIDGLRAVAVLGVVSYHLGFVGGGFVGVDIFFVISGFLIARILIRELARGKPGTAILANFYERRILRILPALVVMLVITYAAATLWLFPEDLKEFGRSLQSVSVFISNMHFQRKTGYFDGAAEEKPLLHTWSLAVEEQFYLLFPLALWMVWRWRGRVATFVACLAIAVVSLGYAESQVRSNPDIAFFSAPSRIWELLTGTLLAIANERLPNARVLREIMAVVGALLVAWAYAGYSSATSFPGLGAVIPVLGSALLIAAGTNGQTLVSRALATPALVGIGLISYSVYLWHWPLIVFAKYRFGPLLEQYASLSSVLLLAVSLLVGYFSWRFVEQPFRSPAAIQHRSRVFAVQTSLMLIMVLAGVTLSKLDGLPWRWPDEVLAILQPEPATMISQRLNCRPAGSNRFSQIKVCYGTDGASDPGRTVLLWGDSHAGMLRNATSHHAVKNNTFVSSALAGCPPLAGVVLGGRSRSEQCRRDNASVLEYLAQASPRVSTVLLVARWSYYAEGTRMPFEPGQGVVLGGGNVKDAPHVLQEQLTATLRSLLKHADNVVVLAPFPEFDRPVALSLARSHAWGHPPIGKALRSAVARRQASALIALENAVSIDPLRIRLLTPLSYFCDAQTCDYADADGRPLFTDTNHLNALGIARIMPLLEKMLATARLPRL
jgi:peptidoglycan/LPS O-acetylase OafA/YrhL